MELLLDTAIVGFADNALIVCWLDDENILEVKLNDACRRAMEWLENRSLRMAIIEVSEWLSARPKKHWFLTGKNI